MAGLVIVGLSGMDGTRWDGRLAAWDRMPASTRGPSPAPPGFLGIEADGFAPCRFWAQDW